MMPILFAKGAQGDPIVALVFLFVGLIVFLIFVAASANANAASANVNYDVRIKGGAPYCPRCNRQVSYRRTECRCCGYSFVFYGNPDENPNTLLGRTRKAEREKRESDAAAKRDADLATASRKAEEERLEAWRARKEAREKSYLSKGIQPGIFAWVQAFSLDSIDWYKRSSDFTQMIVLAFFLSVPAGLLAILFFRSQ